MLNHTFLYFIPSHREFFKIQPGTGDNLSPEDIAAGFTDYVIWNRFKAECLDIDGELPMECVDSGLVLLKPDSIPQTGVQDGVRNGSAINPTFPIFDVLGKVMRYAYGQNAPGAIPLLW